MTHFKSSLACVSPGLKAHLLRLVATQASQGQQMKQVQQDAAELQQTAARLHQENKWLHDSETQLQQIVMDQQASLATASKVQVSCATLL